MLRATNNKRYNNAMSKRVARAIVHLGILGGLLHLAFLLGRVIF